MASTPRDVRDESGEAIAEKTGIQEPEGKKAGIVKRETVEDLKREEALILNWIRDVTATKQARLREIRCKLKGVLHLECEKTDSAHFDKRA